MPPSTVKTAQLKTLGMPVCCDAFERLIELSGGIPAQALILLGQAARKGGRRLHFHFI
jgi:hypothetical protein